MPLATRGISTWHLRYLGSHSGWDGPAKRQLAWRRVWSLRIRDWARARTWEWVHGSLAYVGALACLSRWESWGLFSLLSAWASVNSAWASLNSLGHGFGTSTCLIKSSSVGNPCPHSGHWFGMFRLKIPPESLKCIRIVPSWTVALFILVNVSWSVRLKSHWLVFFRLIIRYFLALNNFFILQFMFFFLIGIIFWSVWD